MTTTTSIRADPLNRLHRRKRLSLGILRNTKEAWVLTAAAWRHMPALFAAALVTWAILRFACLYGLNQTHVTFGGRRTLADLASLLALVVTTNAGPVFLAACLWPPQHRLILDAPTVTQAVRARRATRMLGVTLLMALGAAILLATYLALPLLLVRAIGRISTILTLILLLPAVLLALVWLLRLSFGLPAISLGLPRALAEGWYISRFHVWRALCVCLLAFLPAALALAGWLALRPDPLGWAETLVRPVADVVVVSLTGSLTGLFYRDMRLPRGLRPDVRPSWNRDFRREPIIT